MDAVTQETSPARPGEPAQGSAWNVPCGFVLQESSMARVCACSQEKDSPVEKTLSNSPVKSEREVLLVGEFCLMVMPET